MAGSNPAGSKIFSDLCFFNTGRSIDLIDTDRSIDLIYWVEATNMINNTYMVHHQVVQNLIGKLVKKLGKNQKNQETDLNQVFIRPVFSSPQGFMKCAHFCYYNDHVHQVLTVMNICIIIKSYEHGFSCMATTIK